MQIVSNGDNLHEMSNPVFWGKNIINLLSAEFAQRVVKVNTIGNNENSLIINVFKEPLNKGWALNRGEFVCVEVLRPSQPNGAMSSAVSLPSHTFTGQT